MRARARRSATPRLQAPLRRVLWQMPKALKCLRPLWTMAAPTGHLKDLKVQIRRYIKFCYTRLFRIVLQSTSNCRSHYHHWHAKVKRWQLPWISDGELVGRGWSPKSSPDGIPRQHVIIGALIEGQFSFTDHQSRHEKINGGEGMSGAGPHNKQGCSNHWNFSMIVHTPVLRNRTLTR
jgi:hypothetical protein